MSLTKNVNGVELPCSPEEAAAIRAEWTANDLLASQASAARTQAAADVLAAQAKVTAALKPLGITLADLKCAWG